MKGESSRDGVHLRREEWRPQPEHQQPWQQQQKQQRKEQKQQPKDQPTLPLHPSPQPNEPAEFNEVTEGKDNIDTFFDKAQLDSSRHTVETSSGTSRDQLASFEAALQFHLAPLRLALERIQQTIESQSYFEPEKDEPEAEKEEDEAAQKESTDGVPGDLHLDRVKLEPVDQDAPSQFKLASGIASGANDDYATLIEVDSGSNPSCELTMDHQHSASASESARFSNHWYRRSLAIEFGDDGHPCICIEDLCENDHSLAARVRKRVSQSVSKLEEPERTGFLAACVSSPWFEHISSVTICFNAIFVAYTSDREMRQEDISLWMQVVEFMLFGWYILEVALRLANHRLYFFVNNERNWNWLDFTLVQLSMLDIIVSAFTDQMGGNVSGMRIVRLLKLAKVLRTFRVMRVFRDLAVILESFRKSAVALFWSFVMLVFFIYVFALIFVQGLTGYLNDGYVVSPEAEADVQLWFGSMLKAMLSLYMAMTGGNDWGTLFRTVSYAGQSYALLFLVFTFLIFFAVFNILTGVFVEKAVVAAQPSREEFILEQHRKIEEDAKEFKHMCHLLDINNTGTISRDEVAQAMENELMVAYMTAIGIQVRQETNLFDMVGVNEEEISIDRFVDGCMALRGWATHIDFLKLSHEVSSVKTRLSESEARLKAMVPYMDREKIDKRQKLQQLEKLRSCDHGNYADRSHTESGSRHCGNGALQWTANDSKHQL